MSPVVEDSSFSGAVTFLPAGGLVSRGQPGRQVGGGPSSPRWGRLRHVLLAVVTVLPPNATGMSLSPR